MFPVMKTTALPEYFKPNLSVVYYLTKATSFDVSGLVVSFGKVSVKFVLYRTYASLEVSGLVVSFGSVSVKFVLYRT